MGTLKFAGVTMLLLLATYPAIRMIGTNANTVFSQVGSAVDDRGTPPEGAQTAKAGVLPVTFTPESASDRKIAFTSSFDLVVKKPAESAQQIRLVAERLGGYLFAMKLIDSNSATISIRVPVTRAEEAKAEIRKLGVHVVNEETEAEDLTKQYVDTEARIRNLRAQEQQYLGILQRAGSMKDTLAVAEKLGEVRGEIEQYQAEFMALSRRVETVAITVGLHTANDVAVFGLGWRPLLRVKLAVRSVLDSLGDYASTMLSIIVQIPIVLLWLFTVVLSAWLGWRLLRWMAKVFLGWDTEAKPLPLLRLLRQAVRPFRPSRTVWRRVFDPPGH